jgi:hypothetical protein
MTVVFGNLTGNLMAVVSRNLSTSGEGIDTTLTSSEIDKLILASIAIRFMQNITAGEGIDTTLTSSCFIGNLMMTVVFGILDTILKGNMQRFTAGQDIGATPPSSKIDRLAIRLCQTSQLETASTRHSPAARMTSSSS